jgi:hypothetical protein
MALPLPRPPLPEPLLHVLEKSVQEFKRRAGVFLPMLEAEGKVSEYQEELDRIARTAFEYGIQFANNANRRPHAVSGPQGAA